MNNILQFPVPEKPRWQAEITYRSNLGPMTIWHEFEEIEELQRLVEDGPDWRCIVRFEIALVRGACSLTLEQAEAE